MYPTHPTALQPRLNHGPLRGVQEWFPSISATIGDWYPERNYFQVGMALASGPRFALVIAGYWIMRAGLAERKRSNALNVTALIIGIFRTVRAYARPRPQRREPSNASSPLSLPAPPRPFRFPAPSCPLNPTECSSWRAAGRS